MGNCISISISLDSVLPRCLECITRHPNYAFELEKVIHCFEKEWDELKRKRNDIKRKIEVEERDQRMKRLESVDGWLLRVDAMEAEGDELIKDGSQESANKCILSCCPKNSKTSYQLGKKVAKMQLEVTDLLSKGAFDVVTERMPLAPGDERPVEPTIGLELTFDEAWRYIEDDQAGMIGLFGMGGVGKTTLLTEINNKLCDSNSNNQMLFDVVIWTVVSKTPNLTKVQDDIGVKIGFHDEVWKNKSQEDKAIDIFRVLKEKKFILFLDDIWEGLDLIKLGVPLQNQNNKSKVVFTTRSEKVCGEMDAYEQINVKCLTEEQAFDLFQQKVGRRTLNAHPDIPELAKLVAKECGGLPLALITIGRAMASKTTPQAWHHAIEVLKMYASEFSGMEERVFNILKYSYDSLPNDAIRSCFLYCSLYPEDGEIRKEHLIDQWIFEGFLVKFDDLRNAQNEGHDYISTLVHASLLEECSPYLVKMHDVIRDMAIWIGCECGTKKDKLFVLARAGLTKTPDVTKWEGAERVSLMENKIKKLTETPNCPNLVTLFLMNNDGLKRINSGFFQAMPKLRVLDLSENYSFDELPIQICELVSLQYLNLSVTRVKVLPIKLQKLMNLKYLNLKLTNIQIMPKELLSSLKNLQMLNFGTVRVDGLIKELEGLKYLNALTLTIRSDYEMLDFSSSDKLMSFTTDLDIKQLNGSWQLDLLFLRKMAHLKYLQIQDCESLEELIMGKEKTTILNSLNQNYFQSLCLVIASCLKLKDITLLAFAGNIEEITINNCQGMKELVGEWKWDEDANQEGRRPIIPFAKLRRLLLNNLQQLERICPTALPFPCLKQMQVSFCPNLKKLPFNSSSCNSGCGITIQGHKRWWKGLEWEDDATQLAFLSSFKRHLQIEE